MSLVEDVLKSIDDTSPIYAHAERSSALKTLIRGYEEQTNQDGTLPILTSRSTGRELKDAFIMLETGAQLQLLSGYWVTLRNIKSDGNSAGESKHSLKAFLIKSSVIFIGMTLLMVVGGYLAIAYKTGEMPDNAVFKSILSTLVDILKVAIGTASK